MSPARPGLAILIPAAGGSTRMRGRDKLIEELRGRPLLRDRAEAALAAAAAFPAEGGPVETYVTLPPRDVAPGRWAALDGTDIRRLAVADHQSGLSASFRGCLAALPQDCHGLLVLPADMPDISAADIGRLLRGFDGDTILRGLSASGQSGHPVLFPARDFPAIAALTGDRGGRAVVDAAGARVRGIALPGARAITDLDTPEDWAAWRDRER